MAITGSIYLPFKFFRALAFILLISSILLYSFTLLFNNSVLYTISLYIFTFSLNILNKLAFNPSVIALCLLFII